MKEKDQLGPMVVSKKDDPVAMALNGQGERLDNRDLQITQWIRKIPDIEPPPDLLTSVMQSVRPKRLSWVKRVSLWARSPRSITFTPLRIAPAAVALLGVFVLSGYFVFRSQESRFSSSQRESLIPVIFNLSTSEARSVAVIGTFNGWKPKGYEMFFDLEKKRWSLTVRLPEGRYEYAFLVDGEKVFPDPDALLYQEDGFGNENSVMILGTKDEKNT